MRKLFLSLVATGALAVPTASAFEAMLGGNFRLYEHPYSRHYSITLSAGDIINIDRCNHGWCAVTHGPHAGYIYSPLQLDGYVYGPRNGVPGYSTGGLGGLGDVGAGLVTAPITAVETSLSVAR